MKKLIVFLALALATPAFAQKVFPIQIKSGASDPATCNPSSTPGEKNLFWNTATSTLKYCSATNTWSAFSGSGTVTNTGGNLTAGNIVQGAGGADAADSGVAVSAVALAANVPALVNSTAAQNTIQPSADVVNLTLKEKASQTANPLNITNSADAVKFSVSAAGAVTALSYTATQTNGGFAVVEGTGANSGCAIGSDGFFADSTAHRMKMCNNVVYNDAAIDTVAGLKDFTAANMPAVTVTVTTGTPVTVSTTLNAAFYYNQHATAATAITFNLPTAAAGKQFCFGNSYNGSAANTGALTIATSAAGQFIIDVDGSIGSTGGNVASGGAGGDRACVVGVDSTHWQLYVNKGTWTKS